MEPERGARPPVCYAIVPVGIGPAAACGAERPLEPCSSGKRPRGRPRGTFGGPAVREAIRAEREAARRDAEAESSVRDQAQQKACRAAPSNVARGATALVSVESSWRHLPTTLPALVFSDGDKEFGCFVGSNGRRFRSSQILVFGTVCLFAHDAPRRISK